MVKSKRAILIGAGQRGLEIFGEFALRNPGKLRILAVAEPIKERRDKFQRLHNIESNLTFKTWQKALDAEIDADIVIIATPDQIHVEPALKALNSGYHVLLEKPMALTVKDCKKLAITAEKSNRILQICHVLRYTDFYRSIYKAIQGNKIGKIIDISLRENVSFMHYAHSFTRGNWHNRKNSSPMILAKCCHDLDLIQWFANSNAIKISSFGTLSYVNLKNAPLGVPNRCIEGCPIGNECPYNAVRIYLDQYPSEYYGWPISVITQEKSIEGRKKALIEGPYGQCVYKIQDHDVVDHQVVSIFYPNGITATLTMHGFAPKEHRSIRITGTLGTIIGNFEPGNTQLLHIDALTQESTNLFSKNIPDGHGGGDFVMIQEFLDHLDGMDSKYGTTDIFESLESHLLAFAADESRILGEVKDLKSYRNKMDV